MSDDKFADKSADYIRGYHTAMREAHAIARTTQVAASEEHHRTKPLFGFFPAKNHYIALGKSRATEVMGDAILALATDAFNAATRRKNRLKSNHGH